MPRSCDSFKNGGIEINGAYVTGLSGGQRWTEKLEGISASMKLYTIYIRMYIFAVL